MTILAFFALLFHFHAPVQVPVKHDPSRVIWGTSPELQAQAQNNGKQVIWGE